MFASFAVELSYVSYDFDRYVLITVNLRNNDTAYLPLSPWVVGDTDIAERLHLAPLDREVATLSGGNIQRVVLTRTFLVEQPKLVVVAYPSRGLVIAYSVPVPEDYGANYIPAATRQKIATESQAAGERELGVVGQLGGAAVEGGEGLQRLGPNGPRLSVEQRSEPRRQGRQSMRSDGLGCACQHLVGGRRQRSLDQRRLQEKGTVAVTLSAGADHGERLLAQAEVGRLAAGALVDSPPQLHTRHRSRHQPAPASAPSARNRT